MDIFDELGIDVDSSIAALSKPKREPDIFDELGIKVPEPSRNFSDVAGDANVTLKKGVLSAQQGIVGVADIFTGGYAGKGYEAWQKFATGETDAEREKRWEQDYSPAQRQANENVSRAEGFVDSAKAHIQNPSTILTGIGESLPSMAVGSIGGTGLLKTLGLIKKIGQASPVIAGAIGEGSMSMGQAAEKMRQESDDGLLSGRQQLSAIGSGAITALLGFVGGKVAQRFGFGDVDTLLAQKMLSRDAKTALVKETADKTQGFLSQIIKAGVSEGAFEEMPQSAFEQMWQNWAVGKPLLDSVGKASASGLVVGGVMGLAGGGYNALGTPSATVDRKLAAEIRARDAGNDLASATNVSQMVEAAWRLADAERLNVDVGGTPVSRETSASRETMLARLGELDLTADQRPLTHAEVSERGALSAALSDAETAQDLSLSDDFSTTTEGDRYGPETGQAQQTETQGRQRQQTPGEINATFPESDITVGRVDPAVDSVRSAADPLSGSGVPDLAYGQSDSGMQRAETGGAAQPLGSLETVAGTLAETNVGATDAQTLPNPVAVNVAPTQRAATVAGSLSDTAIDIPDNPNAAPNLVPPPGDRVETQAPEGLARFGEANLPPIMRRRDLVGAIMRVTGGDGISSRMAETLTGEKANKPGKLRGMFTQRGQEDLDDLAMLLREEEGYDVRDGAHLKELIREAAAGNVAVSIQEREEAAARNAEKQYRSRILQIAERLNQRLPKENRIRTVGVNTGALESAVEAAQKERRSRVARRIEERVRRLGEKARQEYEDAIEWARNIFPEEAFEALVEDRLMRIPMDDESAYFRQATAIVEALTLDYINGEREDAERFEYDPGIEGRKDEARTRGLPESATGRPQGDSGNGRGREGSSADAGNEGAARSGQDFRLTGQTEAEASAEQFTSNVPISREAKSFYAGKTENESGQSAPIAQGQSSSQSVAQSDAKAQQAPPLTKEEKLRQERRELTARAKQLGIDDPSSLALGELRRKVAERERLETPPLFALSGQTNQEAAADHAQRKAGEPELTKEQIDREREAFSLDGGSQFADTPEGRAAAGGTQGGLFTVDGRVSQETRPDPALRPEMLARAAAWRERMQERENAFREADRPKRETRRAFIEANQPTWQTVEGVDVLRIGDSNFVAVPVSGKRSSARFDIIDLNDRSDIATQLKKDEVVPWLFRKFEEDSARPEETILNRPVSQYSDRVLRKYAKQNGPGGDKARRELARRSQQAEDASPNPLRVGTTPRTTRLVTVQNGIIHIGDEPAYDYETGEEVHIAQGATPQQLVEAIRASGAISNQERFYGLKSTGQITADGQVSRKTGANDGTGIVARLKAAIKRAFSEKTWQQRTVIAEGREADPSGKLSQAFGFPVTRQYLTPDDIRKIDKHHGAGNETEESQIGLEEKDYDRAWNVLSDPETFKRGKSRNGKPSIEFGRTFADGTLIVAEVETAEDGAVSIKAIWKKVPGRSHARAKPFSTLSSEAAAAGDSQSLAQQGQTASREPNAPKLGEPQGVQQDLLTADGRATQAAEGKVSRETGAGENQQPDAPLFQSREAVHADWRQARDDTLTQLRKTYEQPVTVQAKNGDAIIVAFGGLKHALNLGIPTPEKTLLAKHIQEVIQASELVSTIPDNKGRNDPASTSNYRTEASIDGEPYIVTTVVRNHSDGKRYYDHFAMEKAREGHSESDRKPGSPARPTSGLAFSISELGEGFNTARPDFQQSRRERRAPLSTPGELRESLGQRIGKGILAALEKAGLVKIHATVAEARAALGRGLPFFSEKGQVTLESEMARWKNMAQGLWGRNPEHIARMHVPAVLRELNLKAKELTLSAKVMSQIQKDHPEVDQAMVERLPEMLSDPLYVYPYGDGQAQRGEKTGLGVITQTIDKNGNPVLVGVRFTDGKISTVYTVTDGWAALRNRIERALKNFPREKTYSRNDDPAGGRSTAVRGVVPETDGSDSLESLFRIRRNVITRQTLVKKYGERFFQSQESGVDPELVDEIIDRFRELKDTYTYRGTDGDDKWFTSREEAEEERDGDIEWINDDSVSVDIDEDEGTVSVTDHEGNMIFHGEKKENEEENEEEEEEEEEEENVYLGGGEYEWNEFYNGREGYLDEYDDFDELVEAAEEAAEKQREYWHGEISEIDGPHERHQSEFNEVVDDLIEDEETAKAVLARLREEPGINIMAIRAIVDSGRINIADIDDATLQGVTRWRREVGKIMGSVPDGVNKLTDAAKAIGIPKDQLLATVRRTLGEATAKDWAARNFFDANALADGTLGEYRILSAQRRGGLQSIADEDHAMSFFRTDLAGNDPEFVKAMNRVGAGSGHPPSFGFVLMRFFTDADGKRAAVITETQSDTMSLLFDPAKEDAAKQSMGEERIGELRELLSPVRKTWARTLFRNAIRQLAQSGKVDRIYAITPEGLEELGADPPESVVKDTIGEKSARAEGFGDPVTLAIDGEKVSAWGAIEAGSPAWNELAFQEGKRDPSAKRGQRTAGRRTRKADRLSTAQGVFDGQTVHLIAENLSPDEAVGTLLHEFWHKALKAMEFQNAPAYRKLMERLERIEILANSPSGKGGKAEEWFRRASKRMPEADRNDPSKRLNELAAYAITEYETEPRGLPQTIRKWVEDFLAAVRAFLIEKTGYFPKELTATDLSAIAMRFLREEAQGTANQSAVLENGEWRTEGEAPASMKEEEAPTPDNAMTIVGVPEESSMLERQTAPEEPTQSVDGAGSGRNITEEAYGGQEAYDRAKAEGRTKLDYRQWVQVRTPEFRKWFGDWELAGLENSMRPVRGSDQANAVRGEIVGRELTNAETGMVATVSGDSFGKMMSRSSVERSVSSQAHMQALGNVDTLFRLATLEETRRGKKSGDKANIEAVRHFVVPMPFDGDVLQVRIMAKEFTDAKAGTRIYLVSAVEIENAGIVGDDPELSGQFQRGSEAVSSPPSGVSERFAQMVNAVKGEGVSKVVDPETGEPRVVYHATDNEFAKFDHKRGGENTKQNTDSKIAKEHARIGFWFFERSLKEDMASKLTMPVFLNIRKLYKTQFNLLWREAEKHSGKWIRNDYESVGYDGMEVIDTEFTGMSFIAFHPNQIKSATANTGAFSRENDDIHFQRAPISPPARPANVAPDTSWEKGKRRVAELTSSKTIDSLIYKLQDKFIDLKRMREHIQEVDGTLSDLNDAYEGETLSHQRIAKRHKDFLKDELEPLTKDMRQYGVTREAFERFLHARHAAEANAVLAKRNPNEEEIEIGRREAEGKLRELQEQLQHARASGSATRGIDRAIIQAQNEVNRWESADAFRGTEEERHALSGMSDEEAQTVMDALSPGERKKMEMLAGKVDAINAKTLAILENYGLMSRKELDKWQATYQHYVPLHRDDTHPEGFSHPIGSGFSVRGPAAKQRTGSNEKVTNILGHIAMQREAAITRGEKNRVDKMLFLLASQNPNPDFWTVNQPKRKKYIKDGFVHIGVDPNFRNQPNVLMLRIAGKEAYLTFNERNSEAVRLAGALKNLDATDMGALTGLMSKLTRYFASINTQFNPLFGPRNFIRDMGFGLIALSSTELAGQQTQVFGEAMRLLKEVVKTGFDLDSMTGKDKALWEEFQNVGGTTGYRELYRDPNDRTKALDKMLKEVDRGKISKMAYRLGGWISNYNEAMENIVRLAAYKTARDKGLSASKAASIAKNLTLTSSPP